MEVHNNTDGKRASKSHSQVPHLPVHEKKAQTIMSDIDLDKIETLSIKEIDSQNQILRASETDRIEIVSEVVEEQISPNVEQDKPNNNNDRCTQNDPKPSGSQIEHILNVEVHSNTDGERASKSHPQVSNLSVQEKKAQTIMSDIDFDKIETLSIEEIDCQDQIPRASETDRIEIVPEVVEERTSNEEESKTPASLPLPAQQFSLPPGIRINNLRENPEVYSVTITTLILLLQVSLYIPAWILRFFFATKDNIFAFIQLNFVPLLLPPIIVISIFISKNSRLRMFFKEMFQ